ncbi:sushi, nidogen and EGF-like domain-containing protein 1 [Pelobates fuscus]|uniref:sushi, nidogen and EGF-like domain-containing protein 1 n=1 Tax=Pelobates fuscus TaxID=191477 RepID=UPI002FE4BF7A
MDLICMVFLLVLAGPSIRQTASTNTSSVLYPYGPSVNDVLLPPTYDSLEDIETPTPIPLFGSSFSTVYVYSGGLLLFNFQENLDMYLPITNGPTFLAPFWADIETSNEGEIYIGTNTSLQLLSQATSDVGSYFPGLNFSAGMVLVATWVKVPYHFSTFPSKQVNTFQAVLITDGTDTFLFYNYADLQWPTTNMEEIALAGLNSGRTTGYYQLPGSHTTDILKLANTSNVGVAGRWVFKVDRLHPEDPSGIIERSSSGGRRSKILLQTRKKSIGN